MTRSLIGLLVALALGCGGDPCEAPGTPTSDAGQPCADDDDCEGWCVVELSLEEERSVVDGECIERTGVCSATRGECGCRPEVEDGLVCAILCIG